jgi:hypothetical protein
MRNVRLIVAIVTMVLAGGLAALAIMATLFGLLFLYLARSGAEEEGIHAADSIALIVAGAVLFAAGVLFYAINRRLRS